MKYEINISVIIATHNRAQVLDDTLEHMAEVDRQNLNAEFVIVDNGSSDSTGKVIEKHKEFLPIRHLFESKPGQNCARNRGLLDGALGEIVVFTDDDIRPHDDWLQVISSSCQRWPQYDVFGGRIYPLWPSKEMPNWTHTRFIQELGYAYHDYAQSEGLYELGRYPSSGNMWMRKQVFADGTRFDESIAWHPRNQIMATETIFLKNLTEHGRRIMHCPAAIVGHKIAPSQVSLLYILKRAYSWGRGTAHLTGLCKQDIFERHPTWWYLMRMAAIGREGIELGASLSTLAFGEPVWAMYAMQWLGFNVEQLYIAMLHARKQEIENRHVYAGSKCHNSAV
jgi:glycosyltransferase involved in cell wall biosynthesis